MNHFLLHSRIVITFFNLLFFILIVTSFFFIFCILAIRSYRIKEDGAIAYQLQEQESESCFVTQKLMKKRKNVSNLIEFYFLFQSMSITIKINIETLYCELIIQQLCRNN